MLKNKWMKVWWKFPCNIRRFSGNGFTFANNIHTLEGGMHLTGFKTALTRVINSYARSHELLKDKDKNFTADDIREGLTAVVSVKLGDPQFEGQTKSKLGNTEMRTAVEAVFGELFEQYLEENPTDAVASSPNVIWLNALALRLAPPVTPLSVKVPWKA